LLTAQSLWQIGVTWQWQGDVGKLQGLLSSHWGIVPLHTTILGTCSIENQALIFDWTWPCLSIALNPDRNIRSLIYSELFVTPAYRGKLWQPFDPLKVKTLPDLSHYGLDYSIYMAGLRAGTAGK